MDAVIGQSALHILSLRDLSEIETVPLLLKDTEGLEITTNDDVFIKQMLLKNIGWMVTQHKHDHDHTTLLASGEVRLWKDGEYIGDFRAPVPILIPANTAHSFMALTPDTVLYCIHNALKLEQK